MERKLKICGLCGLEKLIWKAKTRDSPMMCKECYQNQPKSNNAVLAGLESLREAQRLKDSNPRPTFDLKQSKQKPIAKVSSKQLERLKVYSTAKKEYFADHPRCEFPGCSSLEKTLHHMCGRNGDLLFNKTFFKTLCPRHHEWVEQHPTSAKEIGLSGDRLDK